MESNRIVLHHITNTSHMLHEFFFFEIIESERNSRQIDEMSNDVLFFIYFLVRNEPESERACVVLVVCTLVSHSRRRRVFGNKFQWLVHFLVRLAIVA